MNYKDYSDWFGMEGFCAVLTQKYEHDSITDNRRAIVKSLNFDPNKLGYPKQVHSSKVILVNKPAMIEETDGVISINKEIVLSIQVADCVP
ncbi:MAG: polyphenol oxidase family protein, partial [Candidatus Marinimicrobia bacterium]|nr:polyphenol oxidase family protein [Candidatus Neomarinimicrobiota bacterium]